MYFMVCIVISWYLERPLESKRWLCFVLPGAGTFQAVRALMIVGIVLGAIGILISICSLKCIRMGAMEDGVKANMTLTAGIMFIVAGAPTSHFITQPFNKDINCTALQIIHAVYLYFLQCTSEDLNVHYTCKNVNI